FEFSLFSHFDFRGARHALLRERATKTRLLAHPHLHNALAKNMKLTINPRRRGIAGSASLARQVALRNVKFAEGILQPQPKPDTSRFIYSRGNFTPDDRPGRFPGGAALGSNSTSSRQPGIVGS
ncbi:hypothetical protein X777_04894, partial [Ooceraea biroi]